MAARARPGAVLARQCLQKPDAGLWRDALALRALAGGISAGVSCSARGLHMCDDATAMGRIEASAQVEPLPVFAFFFRRRARAGRPTPLPRPGPLGNRAGALHVGRRATGMAELAHVCHHRFATTLGYATTTSACTWPH